MQICICKCTKLYCVIISDKCLQSVHDLTALRSLGSDHLNPPSHGSQLVLICVSSWVDPRIIVRLQELGKCKVTPYRLKSPEGFKGIALLCLDLGAIRGWVVITTPRPLYPRERSGTHCTGGWVGPRGGLDRCGKSRPYRGSNPNRPARSQSLYRLSYWAHDNARYEH
jgi:hypothetical protein